MAPHSKAPTAPEKAPVAQVNKFQNVAILLVTVFLLALVLGHWHMNLKNLTITESIILRNEAGKVVADLRVDKVSGEPSLRMMSGDGRSVIEMGMRPTLQEGASFPELSISRHGKKRIGVRSGLQYQPVAGNIATSETTEITIHDDLSGSPVIQLGHMDGYSRVSVLSGTRVSSGPITLFSPKNWATIQGTPNDGPAWFTLQGSSGTVVWSQSSFQSE